MPSSAWTTASAMPTSRTPTTIPAAGDSMKMSIAGAAAKITAARYTMKNPKDAVIWRPQVSRTMLADRLIPLMGPCPSDTITGTTKNVRNSQTPPIMSKTNRTKKLFCLDFKMASRVMTIADITDHRNM